MSDGAASVGEDVTRPRDNLGPAPVQPEDPRLDYDLTPEQAGMAWPCSTRGIRRDEHADQGITHRFSELDIADHAFTTGGQVNDADPDFLDRS